MIKVGDKIRIVYVDGESEYLGKVGIVEHIDDIGQIHGSWGRCALIAGVDQYEVVETNWYEKWRSNPIKQ